MSFADHVLDRGTFLCKKQSERPHVAHYHGCPECYRPEACLWACSIEPDLGTHKGAPMGAYDPCSTCRRSMCDWKEAS